MYRESFDPVSETANQVGIKSVHVDER